MPTPTRPASLLDKRFKYTPAKETDIAKTFRRVRRELAQAAAEESAVVTPIKGRKRT